MTPGQKSDLLTAIERDAPIAYKVNVTGNMTAAGDGVTIIGCRVMSAYRPGWWHRPLIRLGLMRLQPSYAILLDGGVKDIRLIDNVIVGPFYNGITLR